MRRIVNSWTFVLAAGICMLLAGSTCLQAQSTDPAATVTGTVLERRGPADSERRRICEKRGDRCRPPGHDRH